MNGKKKHRKKNWMLYVISIILVVGLLAGSLSMLAGTATPEREEQQQNQLPFTDIHTLDFDLNAANAYFLGTHQNLFTRVQGNPNWSPKSAMLQGKDIMGLAIDPTNPQKMYAGGHGAFLVSEDGGKNWSASQSGLPSSPDVHGLAMDPKNPQSLYAFIANDGLYQSKNSGKSWSKLASSDLMAMSLKVAGTDPNRFLIVTMGELYKGEVQNGTLNASKINVQNQQVTGIAVDPNSPPVLYAATASGVYKSVDGGNTWTGQNQGLGNVPLLAIGIHPKEPNRLVAIDNTATLYESKDAGNSWSKID